MHCCDDRLLLPLWRIVPAQRGRGMEEAVPTLLEGRCVWESQSAPSPYRARERTYRPRDATSLVVLVSPRQT